MVPYSGMASLLWKQPVMNTESDMNCSVRLPLAAELRSLSALVFATILLLLAHDVAAAEAAGNPLLGRWRVLGLPGKPLDPQKFHLEWEFTAQDIIVRDRKNDEDVSRNGYTIDQSKSPHWITINMGQKGREMRTGIFEVRGHELYLRQQLRNGERPANFRGSNYLVFKRVGPVEQTEPPPKTTVEATPSAPKKTAAATPRPSPAAPSPTARPARKASTPRP